MKQIRKSLSPTVVTIGNFDGLHRGHLKLIEKTKALAVKNGLKSLVCGFNCNTKGAELLTTQKQLKTYLEELDIDCYTALNFPQIKDMSCEMFASQYLYNTLQARFVVVGENFRFGKNQSGDINTLIAMGKQYGFKVYPIKMYRVGKQILSSSYLRNLLQSGKISLANRYLYREFSFLGIVKKGYCAGTQILQIPTANLAIPKYLCPIPFGVYATKVTIDKKEYNSITNVGYAPTYKKTKPVAETYVFDFNGNLYGKSIQVSFYKYIRKERKFSSMYALKKQIEKDISICKQQ